MPIGGGILSSELFDAQGFAQLWFIKTDDQFFLVAAADGNDRNAHLAGFLDHFLGFGRVNRNIKLRKADFVLMKKFLGELAEAARRRGVNRNGFHTGELRG